MAPALAPIRDLLTSFSPSSDFLALSSGDGRIKVWDAVRSHLQTEFADIPAVEVGALPETKRGHLALDYTCMKWVQLSTKVRNHSHFSSCCCLALCHVFVCCARHWSCFCLAEEAKGWEFAARAWDGQWGCPCARRCCGPLEVEDQRLSSWGCDSSVAYSRHGRSVYTAGADGMVCKIDVSDGSVAGKFKSSSKAISALAVSSDGTVLATAAGQLRTFDASDNKKKFKNSLGIRCL
uniref:Uncharacterized protein n=1 Tax=Aegilops tauschii subsp. strangulata TaxID=200361 RepID=A0A453I9N6_AEGTS